MKNITAVLLLVATLAGCSVHELVATFGDSVAVSHDGDLATVEYCPDNTCEVFALEGPASVRVVQDFAYAYLLGVSDYVYLDSFRADEESLATQSVLQRYKDQCPQQAATAAARCIVSHLARNHPIEASFVRFDEGTRNMVPISLEAFRDGT